MIFFCDETETCLEIVGEEEDLYNLAQDLMEKLDFDEEDFCIVEEDDRLFIEVYQREEDALNFINDINRTPEDLEFVESFSDSIDANCELFS